MTPQWNTLLTKELISTAKIIMEYVKRTTDSGLLLRLYTTICVSINNSSTTPLSMQSLT